MKERMQSMNIAVSTQECIEWYYEDFAVDEYGYPTWERIR